MISSNTKETKVENGLDKKIYKALHEKGEIELTERKKSDDIGEEYTLSKYKKLSGLGDEEQLKKEIEVINSLCKSDQDRFKEGVKKRKNFLKVKENKLSEYHTCIEKLVQQGQITAIESFKKYNSLIKKLLELPSELAKQKGLKYDIKDDFISEVIGKDEDIWSKYTKNNTDERSDHSYYEKMLIHITDTPKANKGNRCGQICKDLLTSTNKDIKQDIRDSFIEIQSMSNPKLPRRLAAEILTYGVFRAAISNPSEQNFNKMNKILNEFGLNIKFEKIEVTKLPDENVKDASDQYKKDREVFSATKKFHSHQKKEKDFAEYARKNGVTELKDKSKSVHHYIALKYNAFINEELNKDDNYIITGRQNPWNIDGHDLTHRFDTTGEAIIRFDDGNFKGLDFNGIRKAKKEAKNKKLSIWAPVLQKEEDGKFVDLLSKSDNKSNQGFYLSTDKSPEIIKVPPYCNGGDNGYGKLQSKGISLMKDDKGNKR